MTQHHFEDICCLDVAGSSLRFHRGGRLLYEILRLNLCSQSNYYQLMGAGKLPLPFH